MTDILPKSKLYCCKSCRSILGYFQKEQNSIFCYKCEGFRKINISHSIKECENSLVSIRDRFKNYILEGNPWRYLRTFLNISEKLFISEECSKLTEKELERKIELLKFNHYLFVATMLAIRWTIEDLNYKTISSNEYNNNILTLVNDWLDTFRHKIYLENDLGFFIKKEEKNHFYNTIQLKYYKESMSNFSISDKEFNIGSFHSFTKKFHERRKNPSNALERVKYDFPLTHLSSLYGIYPNVNDRVFSFDDILADNTVPNIIQEFIELYDGNRAYFHCELKKGKNFFATVPLRKFKRDTKKVGWSYELIEKFFILSPDNPLSIPILVRLGINILIPPTTLKILKRLMEEKILHNSINVYLSKAFEKEFQSEIYDKLEQCGVIASDPINSIKWENIADKKKCSFEFDLFGLYKDFILIIECKSFHPHPFYHLKDYRERRKNQFDHFCDQFSTIKSWILKNLNFTKSGKENSSIKCVKKNLKSNKF